MNGSSTDQKPIFNEQMKRLFSNWTVADREMRVAKAQEFREAFDRYGAERFTTAVRDTIWNHATGFFPTLGEFLRYIPDPVADPVPPGCEACRWSGWAQTLQGKATRCACFADKSRRTPAPKPNNLDPQAVEELDDALKAASAEKSMGGVK